MNYENRLARMLLDVAGYLSSQHDRLVRYDKKTPSPSVLAGPASRFLMKHVTNVPAFIAVEYLYKAYQGARTEQRKTEAAFAWSQTLRAIDGPEYALSVAERILYRAKWHEGSDRIAQDASRVIPSLCEKLPDTSMGAERAEKYLRMVAPQASEDDPWKILSQWENRIRKLREADPEYADQCAARLYAAAPGGSLASRIADQNTTLDLLTERTIRYSAETFVPKKPRTTGIVDPRNG